MNGGRDYELGEVPADAQLPTEHGEFRIRVFHEEDTGLDHVALLLGDMTGPDPVLVRVHSECLTGDAFSSLNGNSKPSALFGSIIIGHHGKIKLITFLRR